MWLVLIADVVASRTIVDRETTQQVLVSTLAELNVKGRDQLASPYTITLGDEFQAVFHRADRIFADALEIMRALHPVQVRFSWGLGDLRTPINPALAIGMDGPAFHWAREGMRMLKDTGDLLAVCGFREDIEKPMVQAMLNLVSAQIVGWREPVLAIAHDLYEAQLAGIRGVYGAGVAARIAEQAGIPRRTVHYTIKAKRLQDIVTLFSSLTGVMNMNLEPTP
jgi:hypothetical protein